MIVRDSVTSPIQCTTVPFSKDTSVTVVRVEVRLLLLNPVLAA